MKLIIDIPEDVLKEMKTKEFISIESLDTAIECIKNGTPLDDMLDKIIAEIDEKSSHYEHFSSSNTANGLMIAKRIVGKYKAESED